MRFVDTNVLLYAISRDPKEQDKADRANGILTARDVALSVQVLQEFYVQATRASRPDPLTHEQATGLVESFLRFPVLALTTDLMLAAAATHQRFGISHWDAAILEAARSLGCEVVLSEDLNDGQDYAGVRSSDRGGAVAAPETVVDFAEKLAAFDEHWQPKIIGQVNDLHVKAVKLLGEFVWHQHDDTDEVFIVLAGRLTIHLQGRADVQVGPGQMFIVPRGLRHCPVAPEECHLLLVEPAGTPNTGDQPDSDRTAASQWI